VANRTHVTIRDVASRAGVSHQTVSRVINQNERVSPETRQKVLAAIDELAYSPNAIARYMAKGSTRTFACLSPNLTDYTFASIIEGAETEARQANYLLISASAPDADTFRSLVEQLVFSRRTEGLMVINPYADLRFQRLPQNVPTVFVGARPSSDSIDSVSLDDRGAAALAVQHLLGLGHRRIALIGGPAVEDCTQDRQAAYLELLESCGVNPDPALIVEGDWSATSGYEAVEKLCSDGIPFTALFAMNDRMAIGAIRALRQHGAHVPQDISVIGFDDLPLASYFDPPLTTMRQDMFGIGQEAARLLIRALEQPDLPRCQLRLPAELVVRSSTAAIPL
jgi:DNA-binding LacI/PurR family transcriptional regulator